LPVPNASVKVTNQYGFVRYTKTNESGYFEIKVISGQVFIEVRAEGYAANHTVYRIASVHEVNLMLIPEKSTITGYVYNNETGLVIPGAHVNIRSGNYYKSTKTNESGYFEIKTIPGNITVSVTRQGYFGSTTHLDVPQNGVKKVNVALDPMPPKPPTPPPSTIRGYVVFHGIGVPGIKVVVTDGKYEKSAITGSSGYFEVKSVPGHLHLYTVPKAYMKEDISFEVRSGEVVNLRVELNALPESTYQISFPSETKLAKNQYGGISQKITSEGGLAALSFKASDSYRLNRTTNVFKQVLLNGIVVWKDDIAGDEYWQEVKIPVVLDKGVNKLTLRVYAKQGFNGPLNVWWDDVKIIPFSEVIKGKTTYFKILNANGEEKNYPTRLYLGLPAQVTAVVENHEYEKVKYTLQVKLGGVLLKEESFTLENGEKWEKKLNFTPSIIGSLLKLEFTLYKDGLPYRYFHLYVSSEIDYSNLEAAKKYELSPIPRISNGEMESYRGWSFEGKGVFTRELSKEEAASGNYSYSIVHIGRYKAGEYGGIYQLIRIKNPGVAFLTFSVKDNYNELDATGLYKQVLVDGRVVWEDDVAGKEGWQKVKVPLYFSGDCKLTLRVYAKAEKNLDVRVYWDDVYIKPLTGG